MKYSTRQHLAILGAATIALAGTANAAVLIDEDWENPDPSSTPTDTQLVGSSIFTGWTFYNTGGPASIKYRTSAATSDLTGLLPNSGIQYEWQNTRAAYDTGYSWQVGDQFSISLNATEQSWNKAKDRYVRVILKETGSGNVIYQADGVLPEYDDTPNAGSDWVASQLFTFNFDTTAFDGSIFGTVAGTAGSALTLEIDNPSNDLIDGSNIADDERGMYVDNVKFEVVPEPGSLALLGLGGLLIARRRRG